MLQLGIEVCGILVIVTRRELKPDATTFISLVACASRSTAWEVSVMLWEAMGCESGLCVAVHHLCNAESPLISEQRRRNWMPIFGGQLRNVTP